MKLASEQNTDLPRSGAFAAFATAGRALRSRNYRVFFIGQFISLVGNWMTQIATSWLVYRLTSDPRLLGAVAFAGQIPAFLLAPLAGVLIDRWDLRRTLLVTQALAMAQSLVLAYLTLRGTITVPLLLGLYVVQGMINGFDIPARQAILSQLVTDPADVANAIALNSSIFNLARLLGPAVAGFIIAAWGEGACFMIDGVTYLAAVATIFFIALAPRPPRDQPHQFLFQLREGLGYTLGFQPLRELLLLAAVVSLFGIPYTVLMPVFADDLLHGGPQTLGFLMGGIGIGAVVGALMLASRRTVVGLGKWMVQAGLGFCIVISIFALSSSVWLSVLMMMFTGLTVVIVNAAGNTLIQTIADEDKRGRSLSLLMMCYLGLVPIGGLVFGELARPNRLGPRWTVIAGAAVVAVAVLRFAWMLPRIRAAAYPVLVERGIIPAIADGLHLEGNLASPPQNAG